MRLLPRSLFGRLAILSGLATIVALTVAALAIGHVLERFVLQGMDQRLDAQIAVIQRAIGLDGQLDDGKMLNLPGFDQPGSGWAWRVNGPGDAVRTSADAGIADASLPVEPAPRGRRKHDGPAGPRPGEGAGRDGEALHYRILEIETGAGPVTIAAAGPRRIVAAPIREAMQPLLISLALLGLVLALAAFVQLRVGLRPLARLRESLAQVRSGERKHVPEDQPREIAPLAAELNALINQNEAGLAHARRHVANLAHGLKTPLAALSLKLAEDGRDPDGRLGAMLADIEGRVRHHLGRARAATPGGRVATPLGPPLADLAEVLPRIHAARAVSCELLLEPALAAAIDPQDFSELAGNLLDNAWRHAASRLRITGGHDSGSVLLTIEDDGPGLSESELAEARVPGRRLDESGDGHGFGLSIAEELAELNGGGLTLDRSPDLGGLRVTVRLRAVSG